MLQALETVEITPEVRDPHRFINELARDAIDRLINRLESRGKDAVFMRLFQGYASKLELARSPKILEIFCGTGVATRALAQYPGFAGQVVGADQSAVLLDHARTLAAEAGVGDRCGSR